VGFGFLPPPPTPPTPNPQSPYKNNPNFIELKNLKINNYLKKIILNINHD
jgi:hypothetical protein